MRTLNRNKQHMYYSSQTEKIPIYDTDINGKIRYITVDGRKVPVTTGDKEMGYSKPKSFYGNISFSGGETQAVDFGIDTSNYDATLVVDKNSLDLQETSLIWFMSEVIYKDKAKTIVDPKSADFVVKKITPSLNSHKYLLERLVK